jgi:hypothetical protein
MNTQKTAALMSAYGAMLLLSGVLHILLVKAFVPLEALPCLAIGLASQGISYYMVQRIGWSFWAGLGMSLAMVLFMGWLSIEALFKFIDVLQNDPIGSLYDEGGSFFVLFTVFILSILAGLIQVMLARSNARELSN